MKDTDKRILVEDKDTKHAYRYDFNDIANSFKRNIKVNSNYEFTMTITYSSQYKKAFNSTQGKCGVWYDGQFYNIQSIKPGIDEHGYITKEIKCTHTIIDALKNIRIDDQEPTEDNPTITSGGSNNTASNNQNSQPQAGVTVEKTAEKQTYSLESCLHKFIDNNDQGVKFEIHGAFPALSVEQKGSLYDWISQNFQKFGAYWVPDGLTLKVYDLASLTHKTDKVFRYMSNMTNVELDYNFEDMVNDCWCYGGKMKKDITTVSDPAGGGGSLDSVEAFCKSPINASFGVNKEQMCQDFANRSQKARARGVDVNRLYDTIKGQGISPEWFFAYELQEQNSNMGWLNHWSYPHGDPYNDAVVVCNWIKETANSATITPASEGGKGDSSKAAQWNTEFPKGTIGRVYLQATAAAAWELEGIAGGYYGKPLQGCVNAIKGWGGHTQQAGGGSWGWPFPSVGEGSFTAEQKFGSGSGWIRPGLGTDFHDGLDFGSVDHPGSEVHAIHDGTVTVGPAWGSGGINWYVVIQDSTGLNVEYQEAFSSASDIFVKVGQKVKTGDVIGKRDTNHLHIGITRMNIQQAFGHAAKNDGTWLDPQQVIKNGGAPSGGSSATTSDSQPTSSTTSEEYYSLVFHYEDQESIRLYGRHRGKPIVEDSIYDMDTLKQYIENTVQHTPATVLTIDGAHMSDIQKGDQIKLIAPELQLNVDVVLMGLEGPDEDLTGQSEDGVTLMFNNTGDAMRDVNSAIWKDISVINNNLNPLNIYGATGQRQENHFDNQSNQKDTSHQNDKKYSENQMNDIIAVTRGEKAKYDG